jgi:CheY-like chemotaxis protein
MDFMMPNLDGPGATKAIRAMGYAGKIYGLTGNVLQHDVTHFVSSGADFVLHKPLDMAHFHQLMGVTVASAL